jgi:Family of unknown function (DUF6491)
MKTHLKIATLMACGLMAYSRLAAAELVDYNALAGKPVTSAFFSSLMGWQEVKPKNSSWPNQLIVQTSPRKALLLTLFGPCQDLDFSIAIGLSSSNRRISAGFDKVLLPNLPPCRIKTIQPIDVKAMRAAEKQARKPDR